MVLMLHFHFSLVIFVVLFLQFAEKSGKSTTLSVFINLSTRRLMNTTTNNTTTQQQQQQDE
jgi:hypothetical protein